MHTVVDLPDALYRESEELAASRGATVEAFIIEAVSKEVRGSAFGASGNCEIELPLIHCTRPGTLDLPEFNFDDLLG